MAFQISYKFKINDLASKSLKTISKSLERTSRAVKDAVKSTGRFRGATAAITTFSRRGVAALRRFGRVARSLGTGIIAPLRSRLAGLFAGAAVFFGGRAVLDTLASFGFAMSNIESKTGATIGQMNALRKMARRMGEETSFTATQAAEGMAFLAQAGFDVNKIMGSAPAFLDMAAAGGMDLARAMDIATNVMDPFNLKAKDSARVANILAKAAASTNSTIEEFGEGFVRVAPRAAQFNLSLEESISAMSVLAKGGLKGFKVGSPFKRFLGTLALPIGEGRKILRQAVKAGAIKNADLNPIKLGFIPVLEKLNKLFGAIPDKAKRETAVLALFGEEASNVASILTSNIPRLKKFWKSFLNLDDDAKKQAFTRFNNLRGDMLRFNSAVDSFVQSTGEKGLTKTLRTAFQASTLFFRALGGNEKAFAALSNNSQKMVKSFGSFVDEALLFFSALVGNKDAFDKMNDLSKSIFKGMGALKDVFIGTGKAFIKMASIFNNENSNLVRFIKLITLPLQLLDKLFTGLSGIGQFLADTGALEHVVGNDAVSFIGTTPTAQFRQRTEGTVKSSGFSEDQLISRGRAIRGGAEVQQGVIDVNVKFHNAPPGTTTETTSKGSDLFGINTGINSIFGF